MLTQSRLTLLLLRPSLVSLVFCASLSGSLLAVTSWPFITNNPLMHNYFFGEYGVVTAFQSAPNGFVDFWSSLFGKSLGRNVVSFLFLFVISSTVYLVLQTSNKVFNGALGEWVELHDANASFKKQVRAQVLHRVGFRLFLIAAWLGYTLIFLTFLVPFAVSAGRYGAAVFVQDWGALHLMMGFLVLVLGCHMHVVFMRLIALRPRLFGDEELLISQTRPPS